MKRREFITLLRDLIPNLKSIAVLANAGNPSANFEVDEAQSAATLLGLKSHVERIGDPRDFARAFTSITEHRADALLVATDPFFESLQLRSSASRRSMPFPPFTPCANTSSAAV